MMNNFLDNPINHLQGLLNQLNSYMLKINEIILQMNNIINMHINSSNNIFLNQMNNFINFNQNLNPLFKQEKNYINILFIDKTNLTTTNVFVDDSMTELDIIKVYLNKINRPELIIDFGKELKFLFNGELFGNENNKINNRLVNGSQIEVVHLRQVYPK